MEPSELLSVSPEFLAKAIIHRRERLLELIPSELEQAQALQMEAEQNSRKAKQSRDEINQKVANLKKERNHAQNEARLLFEQAANARGELIEKGELKTPEPKWAKDKLSNKIQKIEEKIQNPYPHPKRNFHIPQPIKKIICPSGNSYPPPPPSIPEPGGRGAGPSAHGTWDQALDD